MAAATSGKFFLFASPVKASTVYIMHFVTPPALPPHPHHPNVLFPLKGGHDMESLLGYVILLTYTCH